MSAEKTNKIELVLKRSYGIGVKCVNAFFGDENNTISVLHDSIKSAKTNKNHLSFNNQ